MKHMAIGKGDKLDQARVEGFLARRGGAPCSSPYEGRGGMEDLNRIWRVGWFKGAPAAEGASQVDEIEFEPSEGGVPVAKFGDDSATRERKEKGKVSKVLHLDPAGRRVYSEKGTQTAPLDRLRARRRISAAQFVAGRRFIANWRAAGYDGVRASQLQERTQRGKFIEPEKKIEAQQAVALAMQALGQINTMIATSFLIDECPLGDIEKRQNWPKGSACVVVRLVLDRLGEFYDEANTREKRPAAES